MRGWSGRSRTRRGRREGIGPDEPALAARNHGLPLEALRYEAPAGLVHYDIPASPGR
ncbi:hypothetical protein [Streptomyces sp. NPDC054838]